MLLCPGEVSSPSSLLWSRRSGDGWLPWQTIVILGCIIHPPAAWEGLEEGGETGKDSFKLSGRVLRLYPKPQFSPDAQALIASSSQPFQPSGCLHCLGGLVLFSFPLWVLRLLPVIQPLLFSCLLRWLIKWVCATSGRLAAECRDSAGEVRPAVTPMPSWVSAWGPSQTSPYTHHFCSLKVSGASVAFLRLWLFFFFF